MTCNSLAKTLEDVIAKGDAFALIHRPHVTGVAKLEMFKGEVSFPNALSSISVDKNQNESVLAIVPYKQLWERGFSFIDDDRPLISLLIHERSVVPIQEVINFGVNFRIKELNGQFDLNDDEYADVVRRVIENEIGGGEGANFVIKRKFIGKIENYDFGSVFSLFCHLLKNEVGAYWTFFIFTGDNFFIGASPELHFSLKKRLGMMNPISGTYRYPKAGSTHEGIIAFLNETKESDELCMVVEEELKMVSQIFFSGGTVRGPYLKEMSKLAHTEFYIEGGTNLDPRKILKRTMFSPAVTGSPIENACRIIKKYENSGRGYYSGIGALIGCDREGSDVLDSTVLIRTADINADGCFQIGVGATLVRHSNPMSESNETRAKAAALLAAMGVEGW